MIEAIVPSAVVVAESWGDHVKARLFGEEQALIRHAVEARRREFATARHCAREALAALGHDPVAIPAGPYGEPLWPDGVVGSITHCAGFRACAAARSTEVASIGIDAEPNLPLPQNLLADIADASERATIRRLRVNRPGICWDRLLFSAKEAVYKAWYPLNIRWLGFEDAVVTIDDDRPTFACELLTPVAPTRGPGPRRFVGTWTKRNGVLATAVVVTPAAA